jgi:pSer/pThr/pTyr-binding forkhead associated (FHA) protein
MSPELRSRTRTIQLEQGGGMITPAVTVEPQTVAADNAVLLYVSGEKTPVRLESVGLTVLGRIHQENPHHPDVDLNAYRAYEKGVSCIHAAIHREPGRVALEDLGSTNGTFINSSRLSPNQPEDLHNGDEIRLGNLFVRVYFSGSRV